jgi:hypothetical protein
MLIAWGQAEPPAVERILSKRNIPIVVRHGISPGEESSRKKGLELNGGKEPMDQTEFMITMEETSNYLHVCTSGKRSRETVKTIAMKVYNTALEKHLPKVLIDVRELIGDFGFIDIFFLVKEVLKDLRGKGVDQLAVIDIHRTTRQDWFLEPVAYSHGLNIRVFVDEEAALKWLGE